MARFRSLFPLLLVATTLPLQAQPPQGEGVDQHAAKHLDGFFPLTWQANDGKLLLTVPGALLKGGAQFLLLDQLREGVGANDLLLDRGQLGLGRIVEWYRSGPRLLLIEPNQQYRSSSSIAEERTAVKDSFAQSVLWGFKIESEDTGSGSVTIDATDFFLHDIHGVNDSLVSMKQGSYTLDAGRSAIEPESLRSFPCNTEVESLLTFSSDKPMPAKLITSVTPDAHHVTVREHFSLIQLPEPGYTPRAFDPRAGYFDMTYRDYSAPLGQDLDVRLITRHRLEKKNSSARVSDPVTPITYYVDSGAPEPIKTALIEGASWWSAAFEAAGFSHAFLVKELPPGADPEDIRYNMIDWVHRSTRGWSYGASVVDPRTGEILKGVVTLGSLRARQDFMIAEALLAPYTNANATPQQTKEEQAEALAMVLQRIHQLAAHEVGHTLGLAHNFAASTIAPGTSVMDYPHPVITLDSHGKPDLSHAYSVGVGAWDKAAIAYGYTQFAAGTDEKKQLDAMLRADTAGGLIYLTDEDARPLGSLSPQAHLWDNGHDPADELTRVLMLRRAALSRFGEAAIQPGEPLAKLEDTLVPLYLLHRYQTEAAAKEIGGLDYRYSERGDGQPLPHFVTAAEQKKALDAVLATLSPEALTLAPGLLAILPPRPPAYPRTGESFPGDAGLAFDPQGAAAVAANLTCSLLFEPSRATRLAEQHAEEPSMPSLASTIDVVLRATWFAAAPASPRLAETARTVQTTVLAHLLALAANKETSPEAREEASAAVEHFKSQLSSSSASTSTEEGIADAAHRAEALRTIALWEKNPAAYASPELPEAPPGQPIGSDEEDEW